MQPKVLIGCPVSEYHAYCTKEYLEGIRNITYKNKEVLLSDNSATEKFSQYLEEKGISVIHNFGDIKDVKKKIALSRNELRRKVIKEKYDYFFSLEQDVIPPPNVIEELLKHKKKIISGVYYNYYAIGKTRELFPVLFRELTEKERDHMKKDRELLRERNPEVYKKLIESDFDFSLIRVKIKPEEVEMRKVIEVKQAGIGCMLIAREVLEKVEFRIDEKETSYDDVLFCEDVRKKGYKIYVDTGMKCKHLIKKRPWTWKELDKDM